MARCYGPPKGDPQPFPLYSELGKECNHLFTNGYNEGELKINVKNITCHNVEVTTTGTHKVEEGDGGAAKAEVAVKVPVPEMLDDVTLGINTLHKWNTDNVLTNEISLQDTFYPGLRIASSFVLDGEQLNRFGDLRIQQKHKFFSLDAKVLGGDDDNVQVGGSIVSGYKGMMGALKINYDINNGQLQTADVGGAYFGKDFSLFLTYDNEIAKDGTEDKAVKGAFYHKVNREAEIACKAKVLGTEGTKFAIGGKYMFNTYGHSVRAKVDNDSMLGLGIELKIVPGWKTSFSSLMDLKNFNEGSHKIGCQLNFGMDQC